MSVQTEPEIAPDVRALAAEHPAYVAALARHRRWNYGLNFLDSGTFALTKAALTETTVLPYFVSQMTANALVIGLSPAIAWLGLYLPQLFGAYLVHSRAQRKPHIIVLAWLERVTFVIMLLIALQIGRAPGGLVLGAFLAVYFLYWGITGLLIPPYSDFYAKHIPSGRGLFLGTQALIYGGVGVLGAAIVQQLLTRAAFPANFVHVLAFALLSSLPALLAFHNLREVAFPVHRPRQSLAAYLRATVPLLRAHRAYTRFVTMRAVLVFGKMAIPFLAIYSLERFDLPDGVVATYTALMLAAQSLSAPLWGYLIDRWSAHRIWLVAALVQWTHTGLAFAAPSAGWFLVIFALIGVSLGAEATAHPHTTYSLSPAAETTRFVGLGNTVLGPLLSLGPLLAGALVNSFSYRAALGASLLASTLGVAAVIAWVLRERAHRRLAAGDQP